MQSEEGWPMIECPRIDRDQVNMDHSGYWFIIRPNFQQGVIEVAICHKGATMGLTSIPEPKNIERIYYGVSAQDIYHHVLEREKEYITSMTHAAYLGKELKKAEFALALGLKDFYQE